VIEQKINKFFGDGRVYWLWNGLVERDICRPFLDFFSFGGVLCLHFPQLLSSPELRPHYPMHTIRVFNPRPHRGGNFIRSHFFDSAQEKDIGIDGNVAGHRRRRLWGGSSVQINETPSRWACKSAWTGFCLICFLMALIYVPLEKDSGPQYPKQGTFRNQWTLDVVYFMSTHLPLANFILFFWFLIGPLPRPLNSWGVPVLQESMARMPWFFCNFFLAVVVAGHC